MHPNEHLIEQYVRIVKKWFTVTNLKLPGNKEIDILALDSTGVCYHIEVEIHKTGLQWGPEGSDGYSVKEYKEKKFSKGITDFIKKEYGVEKVKDIWVCWGVHPKKKEIAYSEANLREIEIWEFKDKVNELWERIGSAHYGDDIIQSLSIIKEAISSNK
jgi:hypothetical protein